MFFEKPVLTANAGQIQDKHMNVATGMLHCTEKSLFTESMTPRRAWKPPNTGNTCSMVSAMVASYRGRKVDGGKSEE